MYGHKRKSWNFCWTELGAKHIGIGQSFIVTWCLHGIDPYTYLVDVLQRVGQHPASRVAELTPPREWPNIRWFQQIIAAVKGDYGCVLAITPETLWHNIDNTLKMSITSSSGPAADA
jgi:hypothetical protein